MSAPQAVRRVTEAALLGGVIEQGVDERLVILSDGAPQFNVLVHALCWVHAERALRRLQGNTEPTTAEHRADATAALALLSAVKDLPPNPHR